MFLLDAGLYMACRGIEVAQELQDRFTGLHLAI